ncbi:glycosyl hydrolase 53 family protein [Saccharothrix sp. S26]|uniref:glycosyl hydrolase 53 family protein n=1 Tax=Saccharothrix sp. S26 TaxID=2907215 RepID=UPI001F16D4E2|nr:glycosyl hydrolase 53 family protein [Saccharothrix sp. S26]MCE6998686.1 glycosyl hydrolase 53 family protein [Saccharothrix sp. S26]
MRMASRISSAAAVVTALAGAVVALPVTATAATNRYEAESAPAVCGGVVASNHSGYSGSGFCDTSNAVGSAVSFTVTAPTEGTATLGFRYANGSGANRPGDLSVNGTVAQAGVAFDATGAWTTWATKTVTVPLNAGSNTVRLAATTAGGLANVDHLEVTTTDVGDTSIMRGADVSTLQRAADLGTRFYRPDGVQADPLDILKSAGVNYARLRIWNNPRSGYNNKDKVLQYARTVKAKGLKLMVDFHYSDTWADPGKQFKPAAWADHGITQLQTDVYNHTYDVCTSLKAQGTAPDSVQIGNEINTGMLWDDGRVVNGNYYNLGLLLKAGYNATKACNSGTQVVIHTARVESGARSFYDGIRAQGVQWDVTGLSYYCFWHGGMANMANVVSDMKSRYGKPVVIVETAYPFTTTNHDSTANVVTSSQPCSGHPATQAGQQANFAAVQTTARNAGASGVFYWEPTWYAVPGNGWNPTDIANSGNEWDNMAVFDRNGRINPDIRWLP